jgi:thiamine biosynthesis lipoprotein
MPVTRQQPVARDHFTAMGSTAELVVDGHQADELIAWARVAIAELEAKWSRFRDDSELNRICRRAGAGPVPASPQTLSAISKAIQLWYVTDGRFDATIRTALERSGYDRSFELVEDDATLAPPPRPAPGCSEIRVDHVGNTVELPVGSNLDLGGIGKGLAADLIATGLIERGASGACVAMGGDVRVVGSPPDGVAWAIPVEDPLDESRVLCVRFLTNQALVTSTTRFRRWRRGDAPMHHLIDPLTGASARRGVTAVIAQADETWWAEGVAKAALVAGVDDGLDLLQRLGIASVIIGDDGSTRCTSQWNAA